MNVGHATRSGTARPDGAPAVPVKRRSASLPRTTPGSCGTSPARPVVPTGPAGHPGPVRPDRPGRPDGPRSGRVAGPHQHGRHAHVYAH